MAWATNSGRPLNESTGVSFAASYVTQTTAADLEDEEEEHDEVAIRDTPSEDRADITPTDVPLPQVTESQKKNASSGRPSSRAALHQGRQPLRDLPGKEGTRSSPESSESEGSRVQRVLSMDVFFLKYKNEKHSCSEHGLPWNRLPTSLSHHRKWFENSAWDSTSHHGSRAPGRIVEQNDMEGGSSKGFPRSSTPDRESSSRCRTSTSFLRWLLRQRTDGSTRVATLPPSSSSVNFLGSQESC